MNNETYTELIACFKRNIAMHKNSPVLTSSQFGDAVKSELWGIIRGLERGLEIVEMSGCRVDVQLPDSRMKALAVAQLTGWHEAVRGRHVIGDLLQAMGLTKEEWIDIKADVQWMHGSDLEEIEEYFDGNE